MTSGEPRGARRWMFSPKKNNATTTMSLFPEDREIPADALDSVQVKLSGLELRRPRMFGNCWLACELWHQLRLDEFWQQRLPEAGEAVNWEKVLRLLVVNRLLDPGSEFYIHRQWFVDSAMDELLETSFAVAGKRSAVSLFGSGAEAQTGVVWLVGTKVGRFIRWETVF